MVMWDLDQLATNKMLANRYGVTPAAVANWRARYEAFPEPVHNFSGIPVYSVQAVDAWHSEHVQYPQVAARLTNAPRI